MGTKGTHTVSRKVHQKETMVDLWSILLSGSVTTATAGAIAELTLDPQLKYWVLLPISAVMILTGILRQQVSVLIGSGVKGQPRVKNTEAQYMMKAQVLLGNGSNISDESFQERKEYLSKALASGKYVARSKAAKTGETVNPFNDPGTAEAMMSMAKGNMASFIPQTIIMWWVNHFFAGFVLMKLPFPLTLRFKEMLQSGVMTADLDVRWVSAISWYFISVLGLDPVFNLLTSENTDSQLGMMQTQTPQGPDMMSQPAQVESQMKALANDLTIAQHECCFDNVEARVLSMYK